MAASDVEEYLSAVCARDRACLSDLRTTLNDLIPDADECLSYGVPALRLPGGPVVAGYAAFTNHHSFLPFSGGILEGLAAKLGDRMRTKSALHFTADAPLSRDLVEVLVAARLTEIEARGR